MNKIYGLHAVREALTSGKEIDKIFVRKGLHTEEISKIKELAHSQTIPLMQVPEEKLNRMTSKNHQGIIAIVAEIEYMPLDEIITKVYEDGRMPFLLLLDGLTDVRNFGAIARSAECFGIDAIVIPERGSVSVTSDAIKTSSGALMRIPVCRVGNIASTISMLQRNGIKVVVANEKSPNSFIDEQFDYPIALVMGSEDTGASEATLRKADKILSIPQYGNIGSLNVSVAAGIMMYEIKAKLNQLRSN